MVKSLASYLGSYGKEFWSSVLERKWIQGSNLHVDATVAGRDKGYYSEDVDEMSGCFPAGLGECDGERG